MKTCVRSLSITNDANSTRESILDSSQKVNMDNLRKLVVSATQVPNNLNEPMNTSQDPKTDKNIITYKSIMDKLLAIDNW